MTFLPATAGELLTKEILGSGALIAEITMCFVKLFSLLQIFKLLIHYYTLQHNVYLCLQLLPFSAQFIHSPEHMRLLILTVIQLS